MKGDLFMPTNIKTFPTRVYINSQDDLQIVGAELTQSNLTFNLVVDVLNLSEISATSINLKVKYLDSFNKYLFDGAEFEYTTENIEILPHSVYYIDPFPLDEVLNNARIVEIFIESASFADDTIVKYNPSNGVLYTLPVFTQEKKEKIQTIFGKEIITYGENFVDSWRCVCGAINSKETEECRNCKRNKHFVLNNLTEPLLNLKILNIMSTNDDEEVDQSLTSTSLTKTPENTEVVVEKRKNETSPHEGIKSSSNTFTKFVLAFVGLLIVIALGLVLNRHLSVIKLKRDLAVGDKYFSSGKYEEALPIYERLLGEGLNLNIAQKIEDTKNLIKSKKYFALGETLAGEEDYLNAIKNYKLVVKEDKSNFKVAQDKISEYEKILMDDIRIEYSYGNKDKALKTLNKYIEIVPESTSASKLKTELQNSKPLDEEVKDTENSEDSVAKGEEVTETDRASMTEKANNLLHSYQKVFVNQANLRSEPGLDSKVVTQLPLGADVYVSETSIEGTERVWCKVEVKNPDTGEIYNGWISSKVLEPNK